MSYLDVSGFETCGRGRVRYQGLTAEQWEKYATRHFLASENPINPDWARMRHAREYRHAQRIANILAERES